jgi:hypothetical protein
MKISLAIVWTAWLLLLENHLVAGFSVMGSQTTSKAEIPRQRFLSAWLSGSSMAVLTGSIAPTYARLEPVNRPDLLPPDQGLNVIQTEKFLTTGQAKRMNELLASLERDTGYRVRVLCQSYPNTPGLAIREYWSLGKADQKDDKYVVLVVDQFGGRSNVLNFNVGEGVKLALPNIFWTRLQSMYGNAFYVRDNGIDSAIVNAVEAIATCLRSADAFCIEVPSTSPSLKSIGLR